MLILTKDQREELLKEELTRIVKVLKDRYCPEKIILFGSLAEGKVHEWSDIDLIIIKETDKRPIDRCIEVARLIKPKHSVYRARYPAALGLLPQETQLKVMLKRH